MHNLSACLICVLSLTTLPGWSQSGMPVDSRASRETIRLYQQLKSARQKGFLFGHQDDPAYGVHWKYVEGNSDVKMVTGSYPGLYGFEMGGIENDRPVNLDSVPFDIMKRLIREAYERGGVITISWHMNNPLTGKSAWDPASGTVTSVLPGGQRHELYKKWLDKAAVFLNSLQDNKQQSIPVILRLFHELNGNWFWWGGTHCTSEEMKQLWHFTISYLRDRKNIHQCLYAFNTDRFSSAQAYLEKYPGDEWVDIIGFDIYQANDISANAAFSSAITQCLTLLDTLAVKKNKIPALTEFGYNQIPDSSWWTKVLLPALTGHSLAYIMAWRNAGLKKEGTVEYFVPFPGQASAEDFKKFRRSGKLLFEEETAAWKMYK